MITVCVEMVVTQLFFVDREGVWNGFPLEFVWRPARSLLFPLSWCLQESAGLDGAPLSPVIVSSSGEGVKQSGQNWLPLRALMNWASPYCQPHGVDHSHTGVVSSCSSGWWQCVPTTIGGGGFRSSVCWSSW